MSNRTKPSFSLNSAGATANATGSFFQRFSFYAKISLANGAFNSMGIGGPSINIPLTIPSVPVTADLAALTGGGTGMFAIGDGNTHFTRMQVLYSLTETSQSGLVVGYLTADTWPNAGDADITLTFVRLGSALTSSSSSLGMMYSDQTIDFKPKAEEIYCLGLLNDTGITINRPTGIVTISTDPNF